MLCSVGSPDKTCVDHRKVILVLRIELLLYEIFFPGGSTSVSRLRGGRWYHRFWGVGRSANAERVRLGLIE